MRKVVSKDTDAALTFTEVHGAQEVDTNHEKNHNGDVNRYVLELVPDGQLLSMRICHLIAHVAIPVCDQNRGGSDFTGYTNSRGLRRVISILMQRSGERVRGRT